LPLPNPTTTINLTGWLVHFRAIANQAVPPINPHEEPRMHLFVYNNIFFSFCYDHRDPDFKPLQPPTPTTKDAAIKDEDKDKYAEQATYVSANNDLKGIRWEHTPTTPPLPLLLAVN
jgi:hypothetical protein